ncbi:hypothetical protein ACFQT0_30180 [Hymenobacter humi]|uniref:ABC transporter permease n=1 Tax=Hymenobacter humi TaxID=1411620 RepID=A0ABW2UG69_9BACT
MLNLLAFMLRDLLRNRTVLAYAGLLLLLTTGLWWLDPAPDRLALNLVNVTLLFVPLYTVIFTITYFHNSRDFTELLVVLPLPRRAVLLGQAGAVLLSLSGALLLGLGLPLLLLAARLAHAHAGAHRRGAHLGVRGFVLRAGAVRARKNQEHRVGPGHVVYPGHSLRRAGASLGVLV